MKAGRTKYAVLSSHGWCASSPIDFHKCYQDSSHSSSSHSQTTCDTLDMNDYGIRLWPMKTVGGDHVGPMFARRTMFPIVMGHLRVYERSLASSFVFVYFLLMNASSEIRQKWKRCHWLTKFTLPIKKVREAGLKPTLESVTCCSGSPASCESGEAEIAL